jgi:hypothetical protein
MVLGRLSRVIGAFPDTVPGAATDPAQGLDRPGCLVPIAQRSGVSAMPFTRFAHAPTTEAGAHG